MCAIVFSFEVISIGIRTMLRADSPVLVLENLLPMQCAVAQILDYTLIRYFLFEVSSGASVLLIMDEVLALSALTR